MLGTPEPPADQPFERSDVERACELLNRIFLAYAWTYWPEPGEQVTEEWRRMREIAMPSFLAYVNQGLMASTQQVEQRVRRYLSPFDQELHDELGLGASQAADICRWITDRLQHSADVLVDTARREREGRPTIQEESSNSAARAGAGPLAWSTRANDDCASLMWGVASNVKWSSVFLDSFLTAHGHGRARTTRSDSHRDPRSGSAGPRDLFPCRCENAVLRSSIR